MRKKVLFIVTLLVMGATKLSAQSSYIGAAGLGIDFGEGLTLVGPSGKYFFADEHAGEAGILFGDSYTLLSFLYEYHGAFNGADGLKWYAGAGPSIGLYTGGSEFLIRPVVGLDYKINDVPLAFSFDWRTAISFDEFSDTFEPARFALGFRYVFD